ncbi:hypothetical protein Patl1_10010 [Pistacia atlantica]|uniref:Uncharacterized protein n=1 Tax=Pistacia atlantica TaxID=434234 RepID=A0ACC1A341_9ROSI|nr:hypothetical protein Patl1_10010 [Pistacia atlantica]
MALLSGFFGCFSDSSSRVASNDEAVNNNSNNTESKSSKGEADKGSKLNKNKSRSKTPPIPVSYFPIGTRFSHL